MNKKPVYIGKSPLKNSLKTVKGEYVTIEDELFYKITHYGQIPPFFMSIVSDSDHWMFISTNGALTAGRKTPDHALFPYYTDDKIQDSSDITGSKTILFVADSDKRYLWEPFSIRYEGLYEIERNCYKNVSGNKLIFEEINHDLEVSFRYSWLNSEKFGFVKKSKIINHGAQSVSVELLDGIQNLLPFGIGQRFQNEYSTLADAYKKCELEQASGLGIYSLSSIPVDKAEPSEAMKATTVWSVGIQTQNLLSSSRQVDVFRKGFPVETETDIRAARGAYFLNASIELSPGEAKAWYIVAEIEQDAADVAALKKMLRERPDLIQRIENDVAAGTENLIKITANADGLQKSADTLSASRHFSNVLFNIMRGGIFTDNDSIGKPDFADFLRTANRPLYQKQSEFLTALPEKMPYHELLIQATQQNDLDLEKLCYEYLPLTFSRRHGDPSRPWNRFSIEIKDERGKKILNYQGNWRDIFQNWEALALSFPEFIESMIAKFANASTADGYNPYRVTRDGFDWEIIDPADPWSYIGYWGDHQIIYLLKLLEVSQKYHPGKLKSLLRKEIFVYANVPYRIKSYSEMLADPHSTIDFDEALDAEIEKRVAEIGSDGKFICTQTGEIYHVNLTEKLLVPILAKLSNFIPEGGIWMNTQRPEWNDANNALVGYGVSMVTLYYLRRHLAFCRDLFSAIDSEAIPVSEAVKKMFNAILGVFEDHRDLLKGSISDTDRKTILDRLGGAGSNYRNTIYQGFSELKQGITPGELVTFCEISIEYLDHSIRANKREDQLYHAYNLMKVESRKTISIRYLYEMLEGQVAVLSSGFLSVKESIEVLTALRNSSLYREDQHSYILYPNRQLARFMEKNNIPKAAYERSELLQSLVDRGDRQIVIRDIDSGVHFNGSFRNANELEDALQKLPQDDLKPLVEKEMALILQIYEDMFDHQSFTGRSGAFYKYEGLGSIYWHMVSKLLLAVQETWYRALEAGEDEAILSKLASFYHEIKTGIGVTKSPQLYGAFPTDPYSHTPAHAGVQQPGMTGQVKEDILSRFGELGVVVREGTIVFRPGLLQKSEFLSEPETFTFFDIRGNRKTIPLAQGCLAFTIAQVPVIYHLSDDEKIVITSAKDGTKTIPGLTLDGHHSTSVFNRSGDIQQVDVFLKVE